MKWLTIGCVVLMMMPACGGDSAGSDATPDGSGSGTPGTGEGAGVWDEASQVEQRKAAAVRLSTCTGWSVDAGFVFADQGALFPTSVVKSYEQLVPCIAPAESCSEVLACLGVSAVPGGETDGSWCSIPSSAGKTCVGDAVTGCYRHYDRSGSQSCGSWPQSASCSEASGGNTSCANGQCVYSTCYSSETGSWCEGSVGFTCNGSGITRNDCGPLGLGCVASDSTTYCVTDVACSESYCEDNTAVSCAAGFETRRLNCGAMGADLTCVSRGGGVTCGLTPTQSVCEDGDSVCTGASLSVCHGGAWVDFPCGDFRDGVCQGDGWSASGGRCVSESGWCDEPNRAGLFCDQCDKPGYALPDCTSCLPEFAEPDYLDCVTPVTPPPPVFTAIAAGAYHTCGLTTSGSAECWGQDYDGESTPPSSTFTAISAGNSHNCGLLVDGSVECWGEDLQGQSTPPSSTFTAISAGDSHTCGLRTDGTAECWGSDGYGQSTPPDGTFTAISAGANHTCGLDATGWAVCWGRDSNDQCTPWWEPPGESCWEYCPPLAAIAAGGDHTCGLTSTGSAACWGGDSNSYPSAYYPPEGTFTAISSGYGKTCALGTDGAAVCWEDQGWDSEYPLTLASDPFTAISVGGDRACGLRTDGTVWCTDDYEEDDYDYNDYNDYNDDYYDDDYCEYD